MMWIEWYRFWFDLWFGATPVQVKYHVKDNVIYVDFIRKERT